MFQSLNAAIISFSLANGGAERAAALNGKMLRQLSFNVHHIIVNEGIDYDFAGELFSLEKSTEHSILPKKISKAVALRNYLNKNAIDVIIDHRSRNNFLREFIYKCIYGNRKVYAVVHSAKLDNYFPGNKFLSRIIYSKTAFFICVSNHIKSQVERLYGFKNTVVIHNPFPVFSENHSEILLPNKYILFYGRLDNKVKNFVLMISAFAKSKLPATGYILMILGDGNDGEIILEFAKKHEVQDYIELRPFAKNPRAYIESSRFTILTSRHEGFPMSIVESLSLGIPVVSVDCESGPNEIIVNEINGLLVPNHNPQLLAEAFDKLAFNDDLHHICSANAAKSVAHLSQNHIAQQWKNLLVQ